MARRPKADPAATPPPDEEPTVIGDAPSDPDEVTAADPAQAATAQAHERAAQAGEAASDSTAEASSRGAESAKAAGSGRPAPEPHPPIAPEDFIAASLDVAAVQTACVALSDAAAHVRRTAMLAEAATVAALTRSLSAAKDDGGWVLTLEGAGKAVSDATGAFQAMSQAALEMIKAARELR